MRDEVGIPMMYRNPVSSDQNGIIPSMGNPGTGGTVKGVVDQIVVSIRSYPGSEDFSKILALYDIELGRIVM